MQVAFLSYSDHYEEWAASADRLGINFIDSARCLQVSDWMRWFDAYAQW
jgi:hypothetical protein